MEGMSLRCISIAIRSSFAAMRADAGDFDHGALWRKSRGARRGFECFAGAAARRLANGAAAITDQKDHKIAAAVVVDASHESVACLDAMDETVLAQEIERAIDRDRGRARSLPQPVHDFVRAERTVACQQSFQDLPPQRREPLRACDTLRFRMRNRGAGAAAVVVIWGRKDCARHDLRNPICRTCHRRVGFLRHSSGLCRDREKVRVVHQFYVALQQKAAQIPRPPGWVLPGGIKNWGHTC